VQTAFVEDLNRVSGVPGSTDIVALASTAESEDQARFLAGCLDMLANYHQSKTPLVSIIARHGDRPRSRRRNHRTGRGRLRFMDQARFVFRQPARSRIAETRRLALWANVAAREEEFSSVGMDRAREGKALTVDHATCGPRTKPRMKDASRGRATDRQLVFFDDTADVAIDRRGMIRWVLPHRG